MARRLWAVLPLLAVAASATACASSGTRYVKNSEDGVYFKLPDEWKLYDEDTILDDQAELLSPQALEQERETGWQVGFDADPEPSLEHVAFPSAEYPSGLAQVSQLTASERDVISLATLRNLIVDVDARLDAGTLELLDAEEINENGHHGLRIVYTFQPPDADDLMTINQTALVDDDTEKIFVLIVGCEAHCYEDHENSIEKVVDSWTVRDV